MNDDYSIRIQTNVTCATIEGHSVLRESAAWGGVGGRSLCSNGTSSRMSSCAFTCPGGQMWLKQGLWQVGH